MNEKERKQALIAKYLALKEAAEFLYANLSTLEKDPTKICTNLEDHGITEKDYPVMIESIKLAITMLVKGADKVLETAKEVGE